MRVHCCNKQMSWVTLVVLVVSAAFALVLAFPASAFAKFNEVAASYPAMQDLGTYDEPIRASQLPDGNYRVTARTTSSMCIFYTNPADADARDSKEQAILMVKDGSMTAVFYASRAYTYFYLGTQDQAAAATNAEGTDASNYIAGDPSEGYVPHLFTMSVPALNTPITFATYSGGNNGNEAGVWYTRQVVFGMSVQEYQQIVLAARQQEQPSQQESSEQQGQVALDTGNVNTGGSGGTSDQQATGQQQNNSNADSNKGNEPTSQTRAFQGEPMQGVKMVIVDPGMSVTIEPTVQEQEVEEEEFKLSLGQILALVLAGVLAFGAVVRIVGFKRGLGQAPRPPAALSQEEGFAGDS